MAKRTITVCDTCGEEKEVVRFTLSANGQTVRPELCEEHAATLSALFPKPVTKAAPAKKAAAKPAA
jgi:hypothetical protein